MAAERAGTLTEQPRQPNASGLWLPYACLAALVIGFIMGAVLPSADAAPWTSPFKTSLDVVGAMWINAIRMTVIPLIIPLLIGAIAGAGSGRDAGGLGLASVGAFFGLVSVLAGIAALSAPTLFSAMKLQPDMVEALHASIQPTALPQGDASLANWFKNLIPANPIKAAADGTMLSLIIFAAAFGFAALYAPAPQRDMVISACHTISTIMLIVVQAVLLLSPLGIFALAIGVGAQLGTSAFVALGYYVATHVVAAIIVGLCLSLALITQTRLRGGRVISGLANPVLVALGTSSSLAALPSLIETARDRWGLAEPIYGFILPFAASTFKPSSAYTWVLQVYFVSLLFAMPLGPTQLAVAAAYSVLLNATVPGIPGGGLIAVTPIYLVLGLPLEGLAIIFAINPITDRFATAINVIANATITALLAHARTQPSAGVQGP